MKIELTKCRWTTQKVDLDHVFPVPGKKLTEGPILVSMLNDQNYFVHDGRHRCIRALLRGETEIEAMWLGDYDAQQEAEKLKEALRSTPGYLHKDVAEGLRLFHEHAGQPMPRVTHKEAIRLHYTPPASPSYDYTIEKDGTIRDNETGQKVAVAEARKKAGFPLVESFHPSIHAHLKPGHCNRTDWHEEHSYIQGGMTEPKRCDGLPLASVHYSPRGTRIENYTDRSDLPPADASVEPRYTEKSPKARCGKFHRHNPHVLNPSNPLPNVVTEDEVCDGIPKDRGKTSSCGRVNQHSPHLTISDRFCSGQVW